MKTKKFDGCSGGMSKFWRDHLNRPPPWEGCCDDHDQPYALGGTYEERLAADLKLKQCVTDRGYPKVAELMFRGVRIGGVPWLPTPWRWGFLTNNYRYTNADL